MAGQFQFQQMICRVEFKEIAFSFLRTTITSQSEVFEALDVYQNRKELHFVVCLGNQEYATWRVGELRDYFQVPIACKSARWAGSPQLLNYPNGGSRFLVDLINYYKI